MKIIDTGHKFLLDNLESETKTTFQFYKDGKIHNGQTVNGPTCQEVIRMLISRVESLNEEKPWSGNDDIIYDLRHALAGFEARALIRHVEKENLNIEKLPLAEDGHIKLPNIKKEGKF